MVDDVLDLTPLYRSYSGRGSPPHRPDLLLKAVLYEHCIGRPKPAQWFRDMDESLPLRWLTFGLHIGRSVLYEFRDRVEPFLNDWNDRVIQAALVEGHTDAEQVSLDGTFVAANASRRKLINQPRVQQRLETLTEQPEQEPTTESTQNASSGWLAPTPAGRKQQLQRYQQVAGVLDNRLQANAKRRSDKRKPTEKVFVSTTDPEAALGRDKDKVFRPLYNVQIIRDLKTPLVLAYDVAASTTDTGTLPAMLEHTQHATGRFPKVVLADAGYPTGEDLFLCEPQTPGPGRAGTDQEGPVRLGSDLADLHLSAVSNAPLCGQED